AKIFDADKDLGGEEVFVEQEVVADKEKVDEDKSKRILVEEPVKPKKKDQIRLDEEATLKLQAEFDEEQRLAREKSKKELEANIYLIETWDDVQAKINVDHQLAERLQMLTSFDMEDLKDLYKLVKAKYGSTRQVEDLDLLLWGDLKRMFKPHVEDAAWRK
nr:hypothetical protein [Tanacetum cinerariifolium]